MVEYGKYECTNVYDRYYSMPRINAILGQEQKNLKGEKPKMREGKKAEETRTIQKSWGRITQTLFSNEIYASLVLSIAFNST